jgi:hypothetical protein
VSVVTVSMAVLIRTFSSGIHTHRLLKLCIPSLNGIVRWWLFPEIDEELPLDSCTMTVILNNPIFYTYFNYDVKNNSFLLFKQNIWVCDDKVVTLSMRHPSLAYGRRGDKVSYNLSFRTRWRWMVTCQYTQRNGTCNTLPWTLAGIDRVTKKSLSDVSLLSAVVEGLWLKLKVKGRVWCLFGTEACRPIVSLPPVSSPHSSPEAPRTT